MNLVNPTTPEERFERLVRDIYTAAGSRKPDDAHDAIRALLRSHLSAVSRDFIMALVEHGSDRLAPDCLSV